MSIKQTPLHAFHRFHNARMVPFAGWNMPVQYADGIKALLYGWVMIFQFSIPVATGAWPMNVF